MIHFFKILFLLLAFLLYSCSSHKEMASLSATTQEVARSDITTNDVDTDLSFLVNKNIVVTLKDVIVEYESPSDTTSKASPSTPKIRSPGSMPKKLSAGEIILSDKSEESSNLHFKGNSESSSVLENRNQANTAQNEKSDKKTLYPDYWILLIGSLCLSATLIVVVLIVLYRKGKLRL